ncbi:MAG TPA: Uma2 family endonuclease [Candidatus Deferrimicrobium sp.]|nr:Uma2 family endonuclease [Candidatus Deferrimicrobium sp.]
MTSEKKNSAKKFNESKLNEYLHNAPDSKCDLVDGQYFHHSPASQKHVKLRQFLVHILDIFVTEKDLGIVLSENFPLKLDEKNWREPDIMFIPKNQLQFLQDTIFIGVPGFIIEILSEDSQFRDEVRKRAEYEVIGVQEYWILDPNSRERSTFLNLKENKFRTAEFKGNKLEIASIPGLFLLNEWLWPSNNFPSLLTILRALTLLK